MDDDIWDDDSDYEKSRMEREWKSLRKDFLTISFTKLHFDISLIKSRRIQRKSPTRKGRATPIVLQSRI